MKKLDLAICTISPYIGGNETVLLDLTKRLSGSHRITLIVETNKEHAFYFKKFKWLSRIYVLEINERLDSIIKELSKNPPDCFLNSNATFLAGKLSMYFNKPCFSRIISPSTNNVEFTKFAMLTSDKIISVSDSVKSFFDTKCYADIETIYEGCDVEKFTPSIRRRKKFRAQERIADHTFVFGVIGHFNPYKRHDIVIHALAKLKKINPNFKCYFVGKSHWVKMVNAEKELKSLRKKYALGNKLIFTGYRPDVLNIINGLDAIISTAENEGLGMSILESMACEKPAILSKSGAFPEIITHNRDGFLVPHGNVNELVKAMNRLMSNPNLALSIGKNARLKVIRKFSLDLAEKNYNAYLKKQVSRHQKRFKNV